MQMVVVLVFVTCNFLAMLCNIFELFDVYAVNVTFVSNFLVTFNHSVNLFIYCVFGERFRRELKRIANRTRSKISKHCCIKPESKSKDLPSNVLELHYRNQRLIKSISLPEDINEFYFRKISKAKVENKFYSDHVFDSHQDFCNNVHKF